MKVTGQQPPKAPEITTGKAREKEPQAPARREPAAREPEAAANRTSLTLNKVRDAIRSEPDVRGERVEALKERIREGRYEIDPERLSKNLLRHSLREDLEKP